MGKLSMESKDLLTENQKNIADLFPNALVETEEGKKIDFDILKQELSKDIVEGSRERYHLDFPGKKEAIIEANRKTTKTLRPLKDKSVDFDNTKNIYIEGDNLEALKILQESYLGKIKCIYIDPPYNTGNDFVYNDKFSRSTKEEMIADGRMDEDGNILISKDINNDSNGRYHSDWLKMMYPRLKLARNLLSDDGVIFISIDHYEVNNLIKVMDVIFGENNRIGILSIINNLKGRSDSEFFATCNEFLIGYSKNKQIAKINGFAVEDEEIDNDYNYEDEISKYKPIGFRKTGNGWKREDRPYMYYPVLYKDNIFTTITTEEYKKIYDSNNKLFNDEFISKLEKAYTKKGYSFILPKDENGNFGRWRWGLDTFYKEKDINLTFNSANTLCTKMRATVEDGSIRVKSAKTLWYKPEYDTGTGNKFLKELFDGKSFFDNPKSLIYIYDLFSILVNNNDIILDFFSGSATTAHAVMKLNAEDGGNRQFILVQLPEAIDENSEAYKAGYKTICDIGEERIRRAGKKIKEENPMLTQNLDTGFRVYKVDDSNMKDIYYTPDKIDQKSILDMVSNVKEDRTVEDLLTQVMLNLGLPLDLHIEEKKIGKNKVFYVEKNSLVACFDDKVDINILDGISKASPLKICLRESSFDKDQDKINFFEKLKKLSPDTEAMMI